MPGCGLTADCPCGFHVEDLMAGTGEEINTTENPPETWQYVNLVCYHCGILRSKVMTFSCVVEEGASVESNSMKIGNCRRCRKPLRDITDLDLWGPKHVQEKHPDIGDPWLLCDQPETREDGDLVRFKCPKCQQFQMTIVDSGLCWD